MGFDQKQPQWLLKSQNPNFQLKHFIFFLGGFSIGIISCLYFKTFFLTYPTPNSPSLIPDPSRSLLASVAPPLPPPPLPPPPPSQPRAPSVLVLSIARNGSSSNKSTGASLEEHKSLIHNMSDEELFWRASMVPRIVPRIVELSDKSVPKVAFMFLTGGALPLADLWEMFFKGHNGYYSIYVHSHPSYVDESPTNSIFYGRRIPSQPVYWGTATMVDAERRLLANALLDLSNQRFVLLSDSCIPLFDFDTIYNHLMSSNLSFLGSFDDPRKPGRGRYNPRMWPQINITDWRKGSQWFEVHRELALRIVSDTKYYPIFRDYCLPPCYMDEHYMPTLVNMLEPKLNSNKTITWVDWSRGGPHPRKFGWNDISDEFLNRIRFDSTCNEDDQNSTSICFLFARKFLPNTLEPLLRVTPLLFGIDP